jgi:hypothetical protein
METQAEKKIIHASGRLLAEKGPEELTLGKLSQQPEMKGFDIFTLVRNEEQIFEELLLQLEREMKELVDEISSGQDSPSEEFEILFKQLHRLFKQKPYYLTLIFDKDLRRYYSGADQIISRIKGRAEGYLAGLIDRGKAQKVFTINTETKVLVKEILGSFQALMNNMQLANKMVRDLKKYQSATD